MPPKPKFTREEVASVAFAMIKEGGVSALTARDLGARMGTSARPIFTLFKNMEDVKQAARALAVKEFMVYLSDYQEYTPAFKRIGMMIVSYGIHEPELFKLLFLQEHPQGVSFTESLKDLNGMDETCVQLVMRDYGLTEGEARLLFEQMWTHALGLGTPPWRTWCPSPRPGSCLNRCGPMHWAWAPCAPWGCAALPRRRSADGRGSCSLPC